MRCKHLINVGLLEFGQATTSHIVNGDLITHDSDFGDYTGRIEVTCLDCGFSRLYGKKRPKWVQELFSRVTTKEVEKL